MSKKEMSRKEMIEEILEKLEIDLEEIPMAALQAIYEESEDLVYSLLNHLDISLTTYDEETEDGESYDDSGDAENDWSGDYDEE